MLNRADSINVYIYLFPSGHHFHCLAKYITHMYNVIYILNTTAMNRKTLCRLFLVVKHYIGLLVVNKFESCLILEINHYYQNDSKLCGTAIHYEIQFDTCN